MSIPQQPLHAMEFDGTARVYTPFTLPDMSAFTAAFWAKRTAAFTPNPTAIQIGVGDNADRSLHFYLHDNRYVRVHLNGTNIFGLTQPYYDPTVLRHYAVVSYSETSYELFFDGVSVGTSSASVTLNPASDHVTIGGWGNKVDQSFYGSVHDARVYNRALTSTEITDLADPLLAPTTAIGPTDGPIFHIAGEGNLYDQSGNGNHGIGTNITYSETATHSIVNTLGYTTWAASLPSSGSMASNGVQNLGEGRYRLVCNGSFFWMILATNQTHNDNYSLTIEVESLTGAGVRFGNGGDDITSVGTHSLTNNPSDLSSAFLKRLGVTDVTFRLIYLENETTGEVFSDDVIPIDLSTRNDPVMLDALGNPLQYTQPAPAVGGPSYLRFWSAQRAGRTRNFS